MNISTVRIIITGATGMVGEGVLHECLQHPSVEKVLVIGRKSCGVVHLKLEELIHADFSDISPIKSAIKGYDACLFCAGVSSVGMNEEKYTKLTYTLTLGFAKTLSEVNPNMVFCYISGAGTDSSEKRKVNVGTCEGKD